MKSVTIFNKVEAVIFDCDGVLVDSEKMSCNALNVVFEKVYNIDIGHDYTPVVGTSLNFALQYYLDKFELETENMEYLSQMKEKSYIDMAEKSLTSFTNCEKFLKLLISKGIKLTVASSGSMDKINFSLKKVNLIHYFDVIISSSEVKYGKPAPDLFVLAAKKIDVKPSRCLVIEDSINGVKSAIKARMRVIGFPGSFSRVQLENEGALYVKNGYEELIQHLSI